MTDLPASTAPAAAAHPLVQGRCPACNGASLFLGSGGYVTCARLDCPDPCAADDQLHRGRAGAEAALARIAALADQHPAGIDTALILEALPEQPRTTANNPADDGPSVRDCAADDRAHWTQKYAGE
jgi:hypothetical protein